MTLVPCIDSLLGAYKVQATFFRVFTTLGMQSDNLHIYI